MKEIVTLKYNTNAVSDKRLLEFENACDEKKYVSINHGKKTIDGLHSYVPRGKSEAYLKQSNEWECPEDCDEVSNEISINFIN